MTQEPDKKDDGAEYTALVEVFFGSFPEALTLQTSLAAAGYPTFMPDQMMKVIDPFITGTSPLDAKLLAPAARAAETMAAIQELRRKAGDPEISEPDRDA